MLRTLNGISHARLSTCGGNVQVASMSEANTPVTQPVSGTILEQYCQAAKDSRLLAALLSRAENRRHFRRR